MFDIKNTSKWTGTVDEIFYTLSGFVKGKVSAAWTKSVKIKHNHMRGKVFR